MQRSVLRAEANLPYHDVKVGLQPLAADADGMADARLVVDDVGLRDDMYDLLTHLDGQLVHVGRKTPDIVDVDLRIMGVAGDVPPRHLALDVPPGYAHEHIRKDDARALFEVVDGGAYRLHRLFNVKHHTTLDPRGWCVAQPHGSLWIRCCHNARPMATIFVRADVNGCY